MVYWCFLKEHLIFLFVKTFKMRQTETVSVIGPFPPPPLQILASSRFHNICTLYGNL